MAGPLKTVTQEVDPDIRTRLRNGLCAVTCKMKDARSGCDCAIAADEIDRLRAALLVAQAWMPTPSNALTAKAKAEAEQVYEALGWKRGVGSAARIGGETVMTCSRCQGNGEIVTDWAAYLHPANKAAEEASVAECPDCDGDGVVQQKGNGDGPQ